MRHPHGQRLLRVLGRRADVPVVRDGRVRRVEDAVVAIVNPGYACMLMEDGLVHRVTVRVDSHHYRVACSNLLFDLDENGSVVLEPLTCLECVRLTE